MRKAFIFDWSGTLSDNFNCFCKVCDSMFKELGRGPVSPSEIRLHFTLPFMKFWNHYFPDLTLERERALYEKYIHVAGNPQVFDDAHETLARLKASGYLIFVVSSDPNSKLKPEVCNSGLSEYLTDVIGEIHEKEHTLRELVHRYQLDAQRSYYVGDSSGDVEAGKLAGLRTIGASWGWQDKTLLSHSKPDHLFDRLFDILRIA